MRVYFISLFNLFTLQELRFVGGIGIEIGLQELGLKFGYRNRDRSWVTGIEIEVGDEIGEIEVEIELRLVDVMYCWWTVVGEHL